MQTQDVLTNLAKVRMIMKSVVKKQTEIFKSRPYDRFVEGRKKQAEDFVECLDIAIAAITRQRKEKRKYLSEKND